MKFNAVTVLDEADIVTVGRAGRWGYLMMNRLFAWRTRYYTHGHSHDRGFSLAELMIVIAIMGVLAAIAIPVTITQQARSANATVKSDLTEAASIIETTLSSLRGKPSEALNICNNSVTYPSTTPPGNTCVDGVWSAKTVTGNTDLSTGPIGGTLSASTYVQGRIAVDGSYCLDGYSARIGAGTFRFISTKSQVEDGTCQQAGWSPSGSIAGSTGSTTAGNLPSAPTGVTVSVDAANKTATVQWAATSGVTYGIQISGYAEKNFSAVSTGTATCLFPADTCTGASTGKLSGGTYTAAVRGQNATGYGPTTTAEFTVAGTSGATVGSIVNLSSAPVASVDGTRTNIQTNPSFETNTTSWQSDSGSPTITRSSAQAYDGSYSLAYTATGTSAGVSNPPASGGIAVIGGQVYTSSAYVRAATTSRTTQIYMTWYTAGGATISDSASTSVTATSSGWTRESITATAPAAAAYVRTRVLTTGTTAGETFYTDAILLEQSAAAGSYFDGSTTNAQWSGAANASTSVMDVSVNSQGRVKVTWAEPSSAAGQSVTYIVTSFANVGGSPGDVSGPSCTIVGFVSCYVTGLDNDTTYTFKVKATTAAGTGDYSARSNAVTTPPPASKAATVPGKPTNMTAVPTLTGKVTLSWTAPADKGGGAISDYIVEYKTTGSWQVADDGVSGDPTTVVSGLAQNTTYIFRVTPVNSAGTGTTSDTISSPAGYITAAPTSISGPDYVYSSGSVVVSIDAPPAGAGVTYRSTYSTNSTGVTVNGIVNGTEAAQSCNASTCTFTWTNFTSNLGTLYYFYIFPQIGPINGTALVLADPPPANNLIVPVEVTYTNECPSGYPIDLGNGQCQKTSPLVYTYLPYSYNDYDVWAHIGWNYSWGCSCGGKCGNWANGDPYCQSAVWGWEHHHDLIDQTANGYTNTGSQWQKLTDMPGWTNTGTQWIMNIAKIQIRTYKAGTSFTWNDTNLMTYNVGSVTLNGSLAATGATADLGRCSAAVPWIVKGLGGTTSGTLTMPCN